MLKDEFARAELGFAHHALAMLSLPYCQLRSRR
jgi:hypothetical protein